MIGIDFFWFGLFVLLNGLLLLGLAINISRLRMTRKIPYGDGGDKTLNQAIRAHGNGVENVTIFGLTLLALTLVHGQPAFLAGLVVLYTLARMIHAYGMLQRTFSARRAGAAITYLLQAVALVALLIKLLAA